MAHSASTARSMPQLVTSALGLLAVLAGILGMHVLVDPHATAAYNPVAAASSVVSETPHRLSLDNLAATGNGLRHSADPAATAAPASDGGSHHSKGCPDCAPDGCIAGLCLLFLVLVSICVVLGLKFSRLLRGPDRPGPPAARPMAQATPSPPSLVQLCISRT